MATIYGGTNPRSAPIGTEEADIIYADQTSYDSRVEGLGGDDIIYGGTNNNVSGGEGNDTLEVFIGFINGDNGDDVLISKGHKAGSEFGNNLYGGEGIDHFVIHQDSQNTIIHDFTSLINEKIDFSNLPNADQLSLTNSAAAYGVWLEQPAIYGNPGFTVRVNWDGTGATNLTFYLLNHNGNVPSLTADHFIFSAATPNTAPVVSDVDISGSEDAAAITGAVNATAFDADSDALSFELSGNAPDGLTFNTDGTFSYAPQEADQALNAGESRDVTFSYVANDGTVDSTPATVTITVQGADEVITGDENANILFGTAYNDIISGLAGDDVIIGLAGNDTITGGAGADTVNLNLSTDGADQINTYVANIMPSVPTGSALSIQDLSVTSSSIVVSGLATTTSLLSVKINGLSHGYIGDLDLYLESPTGQRIYLMSDAGDGTRVSNQTYVFQDNGAEISQPSDFSGASGTFRPFNVDDVSGDDPSITPTGSVLADFTGDLNGTWTLYAFDDIDGISGNLISWDLNFNAMPITDGIDTINLSGAEQIRLTFTSSEIGNDSVNDAGTQANQDGGLAVRIQAEDAMGELTGAISRADDEGVSFVAAAGTTLDIRDLVSGVARGDQFNVATLGTQQADIIDAGSSLVIDTNYYVNGGQGDDQITGGDFNDFLVGGAGNDNLIGVLGNDSFIGGSGNDAIDGGSGNDAIDGGMGDDLMIGGLGDDVIIGGAGNDAIDAGAGADTVNLNLSTDGADQINTYAATVTPNTTVVVTGAGFNIPDGSADSSVIQVAGLKNDATLDTVTIKGLSHTFARDLDIYLESPTGQRIYLMSDGGEGNDLSGDFVFSDNGQIITDANTGIFNAGTWHPFNLVQPGQSAASETTVGLVSTFSALTGDLNGTWTLHAADDAGGDFGSFMSWEMNFATSLDPVTDGIDTINLSGAEQIRLTFTSSEVGNDSDADAGTQANQDGGLAVRIQAEDAMGELTGAISRADDEGVRFVADNKSTLDIRDLVSGVARGDQFNVAVLGTNAADVFDESQQISNNTSNNTHTSNYYINAGQGDDLVISGSGNDFLVGGAGNDSLMGGLGNDSFIGGGGNDTIDGGMGDDLMIGGLGNDSYVVDNALDVVQEMNHEGIDSVHSSVTYKLGENVEHLTLTAAKLTGTGNVLANTLTAHESGSRLYGGGGTDTLIGAMGSDLLDGGLNADRLEGGMGDDIYVVNLRGDAVVEAADAGIDTVWSSINYKLGDHVEHLTLTAANLIGTGNVLANTLTAHQSGSHLNGAGGADLLIGDIGNDLLDGGVGIDILAGGAGNDLYRVSTRGDVTIEHADGGIDTVESTISWNLADHLENLTLTGSANSNAVGNNADNTLMGNSANNILDGRLGLNNLIGGAGDDVYVLNRFYAQNTITESTETNGGMDVVLLGNNVKASQVWFSQVGSDLQASVIGTSASVLIKDWYSAGMSVETFRLSNGSELQANEVQALVDAMSGFTQPAMGNTELSAQYQAEFGAVISNSWSMSS